MKLRIESLTGSRLAAATDRLAQLRIAVFREYPYLYEGTLDYESEYLRQFAQSQGAVMVAAFDGEALVGAATAAPLESQLPEFQGPFEARGEDVSSTFYLGESVLLPEYRGQGVGHVFFDQREARARELGDRQQCVFCAVVRAHDHPARPRGYSSLDPFWMKRGYSPLPGVTTELAWKELGELEESHKSMQFWGKALS